MSNQTNRPKITGSIYSLKSSIIFIAVFVFIISFLLMGTAFARLFIALFVSLTGLNLVTYAVARRTNWFEFDDKNKMIVKAFQRRIPYDKITTIVITEVWRGVTVNVKTGRFHLYSLAGLSKEHAESAEKEFIKRFPLELIRKKSYSRKRLAIPIAIALLIGIFATANLLYSMHQMGPSEVVTAQKKDWMIGIKPTKGKQYQINGIDFQLPDRFVEVKQDPAWRYFEDNVSRTKINVGPGVVQGTNVKHGSMFGYLTGIQHDYDLVRLAYKERFGLLPTLANSATFGQLFEIKLYEISRGKLHGLVLQGMKGSKSVAEIVVTDKKTGLHFYVSRPGEIGKVQEDFLESIAASIQVTNSSN